MILALVFEVEHGDAARIRAKRRRCRASAARDFPDAERRDGENDNGNRDGARSPPPGKRCRDRSLRTGGRSSRRGERARAHARRDAHRDSEKLGECRGGLRTIGRHFAERGEDRVLDLLRNGAAHDADARHLLHGMPRHDLHRVLAGERRLARQHLVQHAAEAVEVRGRPDGLSARLLGRHVVRRAHRHPGRGELLRLVPSFEIARAMPKSATRAWPSERRMFSGLMSRCTTPFECA